MAPDMEGFSPNGCEPGGGEEIRLLADAMPQAVRLAGADGVVSYCNRAWVAYTGCAVEDLPSGTEGLLHPDDAPGVREGWNAALAAGKKYEAEYRLRRAEDGAYRWFAERATPICDDARNVVRWVCSATDIDDEKRAAKKAAFFAEADAILFESYDMQGGIERLLRLIVAERAADFAVALRVEENEKLRTVALAHRDQSKERLASVFLKQHALRPETEARIIARLRRRQPLVDEGPLEASQRLWDYLVPATRELALRSLAAVPLHARGTTYGALVLYRTAESDGVRESWNLPFLLDIGRRTSIALENARVHEQERHIAETLQKSALPQMLPTIPGLRFCARYVSGSNEAEVGGDWYDACTLKDGTLVLSVGDVAGHGVQGASAMGFIRQAIDIAAVYEPDPARVLDAVDDRFLRSYPNATATAFLAFVDPQRRRIRYANAGHPSPLLRRREGTCVLDESCGLPLGLRSRHGEPERSRERTLDDAELFVMYTRGLIGSAGDATEAQRRLREAVASDAILRVRDHAQFIQDVCAARDRQSDAAVLTMTLRTGEQWSFDAENAKTAQDTRGRFVGYLQDHAETGQDIAAAELIFGELIGNVVRHAPGPIGVHVDWKNRRPVLHVLDRGQGVIGEGNLPNDPLSEGGRGLFIIKSLSEQVAVERIEGYGNHVSVVLPIERKKSAPSSQGLPAFTSFLKDLHAPVFA